MKIAIEKAFIKNDYELLFKDSSEYFVICNAKMFQEGNLIRFICFNILLEPCIWRQQLNSPNQKTQLFT